MGSGLEVESDVEEAPAKRSRRPIGHHTLVAHDLRLGLGDREPKQGYGAGAEKSAYTAARQGERSLTGGFADATPCFGGFKGKPKGQPQFSVRGKPKKTHP